MIRTLPLLHAHRGLSVIVNVANKVGPKEANQRDDVFVVRALLRLAATGQNLAAEIGVPDENGRFDATTGFWIFRIQHYYKQQHPAQIIDGVVSPAHGATYAHGIAWTIVMLNFLASKNNPVGYKNFMKVSSFGLE